MKNNRQEKVHGISSDLKFKISEAYKSIRTNIAFSLIKKECKTIVFTSANPAEGKSTVSVNIAISLAQTESKVLLIDADLRRPTVYRFLGLSNTPGITNLLSGMNSLDEIVHTTPYKNLDVICAGSIAPNPAEMLASEAFAELLKSLQEKYDYILIDSTPINVVADALLVAKHSDGVILVVREKKCKYNHLDAALKKLQMSQAKVIGMVLNGTHPGKHTYYSYYEESDD